MQQSKQNTLVLGVAMLALGLFLGMMLSSFQGNLGQGAVANNPLRVATWEELCIAAGGHTETWPNGYIYCVNAGGEYIHIGKGGIGGIPASGLIPR